MSNQLIKLFSLLGLFILFGISCQYRMLGIGEVGENIHVFHTQYIKSYKKHKRQVWKKQHSDSFEVFRSFDLYNLKGNKYRPARGAFIIKKSWQDSFYLYYFHNDYSLAAAVHNFVPEEIDTLQKIPAVIYQPPLWKFYKINDTLTMSTRAGGGHKWGEVCLRCYVVDTFLHTPTLIVMQRDNFIQDTSNWPEVWISAKEKQNTPYYLFDAIFKNDYPLYKQFHYGIVTNQYLSDSLLLNADLYLPIIENK